MVVEVHLVMIMAGAGAAGTASPGPTGDAADATNAGQDDDDDCDELDNGRRVLILTCGLTCSSRATCSSSNSSSNSSSSSSSSSGACPLTPPRSGSRYSTSSRRGSSTYGMRPSAHMWMVRSSGGAVLDDILSSGILNILSSREKLLKHVASGSGVGMSNQAHASTMNRRSYLEAID
jgi:hypothetical protein